MLAITASPIWYSQWGQLQLIKWEFARSSESLTDDKALTLVAKAYAAMGELFRAQRAAEKVSKENTKASALIEIARLMAEIGAKQQAIELLKQAQGVAENIIHDDSSKAFALAAIARLMAEIGAERRDEDLLKQAQGVAEKVSDEGPKAYALAAIAKAMAEIGAKQQAMELLKRAQEVAEKVNNEDYKASPLAEIAKIATAMGNYRLARAMAFKQVRHDWELGTLALILETWARSKDPRLADKIWED